MSNAEDEIRNKWTMIPHFGGLEKFEVKNAKSHLRRATVNNVVTYEELCTLLCYIEAILRSRLLLPISTDDPNTSFYSVWKRYVVSGNTIAHTYNLTTKTVQVFETHLTKRRSHKQN